MTGREELREEVARIVDRTAWSDLEGPWETDSRWLSEDHRARCLAERQGYALAKADAILAMIAAPQAGWVMVPREPTREMLVEGSGTSMPLRYFTEDDARRAYRAMIAAAPPVLPVPVSEEGWQPIETAPRDGTR